MNPFDFVRELAWARIGVSLGTIVGALLAGLVANSMAFRVLDRFARSTKTRLDDLVVKYGRKPGRLLLPALFLSFVDPWLELTERGHAIYLHATSLFSIAAGTYLALNLTGLMRDVLLERVEPDGSSALSTRKIVTQIHVAEKVLIFLILAFSMAFMLMTFDRIRQVGISILASAGVAGVILGFAAQRSLGTLLAGLQIAFTQPIRIGDTVIVEGEWGTIEEITLTYVVVKVWDLRRLVVPITYFIEKPFQNLTRTSTELVGTVFFYADYALPVDAVRTELDRVVRESGLWDEKTCRAEVTDAKPNAVEVRCSVSASDASKLWDLRCLVREKLIAYVHEHHFPCLPRIRADLDRQPTDRPTAESTARVGVSVRPAAPPQPADSASFASAQQEKRG